MKFEYESCSDGDTNEQQMIINLGTKSEKEAGKLMEKLVKIFNKNETIVTKKGARNGKSRN